MEPEGVSFLLLRPDLGRGQFESNFFGRRKV